MVFGVGGVVRHRSVRRHTDCLRDARRRHASLLGTLVLHPGDLLATIDVRDASSIVAWPQVSSKSMEETIDVGDAPRRVRRPRLVVFSMGCHVGRMAQPMGIDARTESICPTRVEQVLQRNAFHSNPLWSGVARWPHPGLTTTVCDAASSDGATERATLKGATKRATP